MQVEIPHHSWYLSWKGIRPVKMDSCWGISDITVAKSRFNSEGAVQPAVHLYADRQ